MRRGAKPGKAKVVAKRPRPRTSPKDEASKRHDLEKRLAESLEREKSKDRALTEALEQQTATREILRVIAGSGATDVTPVFDEILRSALALCDSPFGVVLRLEGDEVLHLAAFKGPSRYVEIMRGGYPHPLTRDRISGLAILERRAVHAVGLRSSEQFPHGRALANAAGFDATVFVPMLKEGRPIGAIGVGKADAFSDDQIALLQTFADQAVIAIENVRLFKELEARNSDLTEALEQQTATSEILRVIASSPTDVEPVLMTVAERAARLCEANDAMIFRKDGTGPRLLARWGSLPAVLTLGAELAMDRTSVVGRAVIDARVIHIPDVQAAFDEFTSLKQYMGASGVRTALAVPLLREGVAIGAILIRRLEVEPFTDKQIGLLTTFADQAVIAMENVRLFTELEGRNRDLTATSEILQVISRSPTDTQPVFDAIVRSAAHLCDGLNAAAFLYDGELIHNVALSDASPEATEEIARNFPQRPNPEFGVGRVALTGAIAHSADVLSDSSFGEAARRVLRSRGIRALLAAPMLREGRVVGVISVGRAEPGLFPDSHVQLLQTFADQAVIAVENVRLFNETKEALDQQTATSDILRVISQSQTDVQPVFDAIVASAVRLLGAYAGGLTRIAGDQIELTALTSTDAAGDAALRALYPHSLEGESLPARVIRARAPVNIANAQTDPRVSEVGRVFALARGYQSLVLVPLLRHDDAIGTISVSRRDPGGFTDDEIALLKAFADQAVIAIENVRLFKELQASNRELTTALDTQTATSDILRVISRSQTNVQPVFDAIVHSAVRLLDGYTGLLTRVAGDRIELAAFTSTDVAGDTMLQALFPRPLRYEGPHAWAIRDRTPLNIADAEADPQLSGTSHAYARIRGYRSWVTVPMLHHDEAVGTIAVTRREPGGFTNDEIALLKTFADQAVIAIENVRLFNELEGRNRDLTATSEILRVISQSPTDVQPVFDTIVRSAVRLCDGLFGTLFQFDGELIHVVAQHNVTPEGLEELHRIFPTRPTRGLQSSRAILERTVVHVPDVELDPEYQHLALSRAVGFRSALAVPLLREGAPIGVIAVTRAEPGRFSDNQVELLKTFADQAVIAVENVRLFKELQARTGELTQSVEQLTALGEVSRAVSSTLDVETVLDTIVSRATQLAGADGCAISEYDDVTELFHVRATHGIDAALIGTLRAMPLRKGEGTMGRAAETREPTQIADIAVPGAYQSHVRDMLIDAGYRALLSVPLLREEQIIGSLSLLRKVSGEFPLEVIEVLKTFATQSALAIQNARLFREIADKSAQLEAASRHKSEFLANMSHELRTPLNAIIGFSEVLVDRMFGELNEKQDEYLKDIYASGQHLLSLINDILDLSKIEAGRMELEATDFDLPSAIDNALILVRERATRRGIALGRTIDEQLGMLRGDERKVKQVLLNLLSNALKFTPEGGRIDVSARLLDGVAEIAVADTGVGIAPEDQEAVFEEFRQVGTADKKVEGTGLGLALSRKFIELHGGRIWVKSQVGHGSTFTFTLPVRREE